jgi:C-terminal processing protease CtpA/Prc
MLFISKEFHHLLIAIIPEHFKGRSMFTRFIAFVLLLTTIAFAGGPLDTKAKQIAAMEAVLMELEVHYGMIHFKEHMFGVNYENLRKKYTKMIKEAMTPEEFAKLVPKRNRKILNPDQLRSLLIAITAEFQDGHLNQKKRSGNLLTVGLMTAPVDGRLFVTGFDSNVFVRGNSAEPVLAGDEIIAINGVDIQKHVEQNMLYTKGYGGTYVSQKNRALRFLLNRPQSILPQKYKHGDSVNITYRRMLPNGSTIEFDGRYQWADASKLKSDVKFVMDLFPDMPQKKAPKPTDYSYGMSSHKETHFSTGLRELYESQGADGAIVNVGKLLNMEIYENLSEFFELKSDKLVNQGAITAGQAEAMTKAIKEKAMSPSKIPISRLEAYTVKFQGKTFGVLRLPDYSPQSFGMIKYEFNWMAEVMKRFMLQTDGLIIDQNANGGGYIHYVSHLVRLFAQEDAVEMVKADQKLNSTFFNVMEAWLDSPENDILVNMEDMDGIEANNRNRKLKKVFYENYYDYHLDSYASKDISREELKRLKDMYRKGLQWSGLRPYMGLVADHTLSHAGKSFKGLAPAFKKPILFLNDAFSGSGGDFTPSILQQNKLVTLFGENSAGLGGPVYRSTDLPGSENWMRCTYAYCERPDGLPIENIGAVPQIKRSVSPFDLKNKFTGYATDVLTAATMLAEEKSIEEIQSAVLIQEMQRAGVQGPTALSLVAAQKKINEKFVAIEALGKITKKNQGEVARLYQEMLKEAKPLINKVHPEHKRFLTFPVPSDLAYQDVILSSQHRGDAAANRVNEMKQLKRFKSFDEMLTAIENIFKAVPTSGTSNTCDTYFKSNKDTYKEMKKLAKK